jgi:hypothetical protein
LNENPAFELDELVRTDGDIFAGRHRHRSGHQSGNACDQHIVSRRCRCCNADDQARGRNDTVVGPQNGGSEPSDPIDDMVLGVRAEATHIILLVMP